MFFSFKLCKKALINPLTDAYRIVLKMLNLLETISNENKPPPYESRIFEIIFDFSVNFYNDRFIFTTKNENSILFKER